MGAAHSARNMSTRSRPLAQTHQPPPSSFETSLLQMHAVMDARVRELEARVRGLEEELRAPRSVAPTPPSSAPFARLHREARPPSRPALERAQQEKQSLLDALDATGWNRVKAAARLGMPRTTFYRRMTEYGIHAPGADR